MLQRTEEAKFSPRKECMNCPGRFHREKPNKQNKYHRETRKGVGRSSRLRKSKNMKV